MVMSSIDAGQVEKTVLAVVSVIVKVTMTIKKMMGFATRSPY